MQHRLADAKHRSTLLQQKLITQEAFHRDEMQKARAERDAKTLALEEQLGAAQAALSSNAEIKTVLGGIEALPSEAQYRRLQSIPPMQLGAAQAVQVHMYEAALPMARRLEGAEAQLTRVTAAHAALEGEHGAAVAERDHLQGVLAKLRHEDARVARLEEVELRASVLTKELALARDESADLASQLAVCEEERTALHSAETSRVQELELLRMDKEHLTLTNRDLGAQDAQLRSQVSDLQQTVRELSKSREESYEKLLAAKEQQTAEFERKVTARVAEIQDENRLQLERLQHDTREMYARKTKDYELERDGALAKARQVEVELRDARRRCEELGATNHELKMSCEGTISSLATDVKLKAFELERSQLVVDEVQATMAAAKLEAEKLRSKVEVVTKEYYELKVTSDARIGALTAQQSEQKANLATYEALEKELDEVVMHAAEANDPSHVLVSYGYGSNVPSTAKRRLKHGILLARRLLASQKDVHGLRAKLEEAAGREKQLGEELGQANAMLDTTSQPYHYMVEGMRTRDQLVKDLRHEAEALRGKVAALERERAEFARVKNAMSADLEQLLSNRQELDEVRTHLASLARTQQHGGVDRNRSAVVTRTSAAPLPGARTRSAGHVRKPSIQIEGVGVAQPWWYNRLVTGGAEA